MTSPGIVFVDETVNLYRNLRLPKNWRLHLSPTWGSLQASMQYVFKRYPDASHYGWLADDTVPRTEGWDTELERSAGSFGFAHANDDWHSHDPTNRYEYERGDDMSAGLCWGGDLVRTVGWWALPGVTQAGIDTAWTALIGPLGLVRYRHDIVVEHKHYRTGKRPEDQGDSWVRDGRNYIEADIKTRDDWIISEDYVDTLVRVAMAHRLDPDRERLHRDLVQAKASAVYRPGMPGARFQNILNEFEGSVHDLIHRVFGPDTHAKQATVPR